MSITHPVISNDTGMGVDGTPFDAAWVLLLMNAIDAMRTEQVIALTGVQNNLSITAGALEADVVVFTNPTLLQITGIAAPASPAKPGKLLILSAVGGQVDLFHQNGGSVASNRLQNIALSGPTSLGPGGTAMYVWSGASGYWRLVHHEQGSWIAAAYAAGNFTANAGGSWGVSAGDVVGLAYYLRGKQLTVVFQLAPTTVGGVPTELRIGQAAWGGYAGGPVAVFAPLATLPAYATVAISGTYIGLSLQSGGAWPAGADATFTYGQIMFPVT